MESGERVDRRTKVLEFCDDEATEYAILSHRWIDPTEVNYEEVVDLAKMNTEERDEIRQRRGYKKILDTCEQAKRDEYEWVWVDTCCIDKRSSAELSEAINSMYRWYANSGICYAYLHDVDGPSFPTEEDDEAHPESNGWPEWFSRGWTLQEMVAPSNVQFFNMNWTYIGDKGILAPTLTHITGVPERILKEGLAGNRPCVAQIMSWAAKRRTTRVEDRAYSLMGLLDVNMTMLYGEGKKAFRRLQLEIIHTSNDQSIFAWDFPDNDVRASSILADDPSFFRNCSRVELISDRDEFVRLLLEEKDPGIKIPSIDQDYFDGSVFPITNRGVHIWMFLSPYEGSDSFFKAHLPCRDGSHLVAIRLAMWNSNFYRYSFSHAAKLHSLQFRQVYLRYQDMPCNVTFEIDDSAITENGFTCSDVYPKGLTENTLKLTDANPLGLCIKTYSERRGNGRLAVAFGQCFGQDWIHLISNPPSQLSRFDAIKLVTKGPGRSQSMADVMPSRRDCLSRMWVHDMCLPRSTWFVRTCRIMWDRSKIRIHMDVSRNSRFQNGLDEWKVFDIEVSDFSLCTWIISIIIHREPTILFRTRRVSCCAMRRPNLGKHCR